MEFPNKLKYTKMHEWISVEEKTGTCGITAWASEQLGEVVSVELPEEGREVKKDEAVGAVESSKASSEIYAPVSGKIIEVNTQLEEVPEKINESPYDEGWIFRLELLDPGETGSLLDAESYKALVESQEEK